jgi:hypothetical protein
MNCKKTIFWAFISKSPFFSKKGVAHGVYLPAAVKGLRSVLYWCPVYKDGITLLGLMVNSVAKGGTQKLPQKM